MARDIDKTASLKKTKTSLKKKINTPPKESPTMRTLDIFTDSIASVTSVVLIAWSLYVLMLENFDTFHNVFIIYTVATVLIFHIIINIWLILREMLDKRFKYSQWKWGILLHTIITIMAIIWTIRSISSSSAAWCRKTYKIIFGILAATSSIYLVAILICGPGSVRGIKILRSIYNNDKSTTL